MASLYQSAKRSRRILFIILIIALLVVVNDFVGSISKNIEITQDESARFYMSADRYYGEIPSPSIPAIQRDTNNDFSYASEGFFGEFPDVAYVYRLEVPREKLLSFENAQSAVEVLGFEPSDYTDLGQDTYQWSKIDSSSKVTYNKVTQMWRLSTDFAVFQSEFPNILATQRENSYISAGRSLYNKLGFDTFGIDNGEIAITYAELKSDGIFYETEQESSRFVFIDVFRNIPFADLKDKSELPTLQAGQVLPESVSALVYKSNPRQGSIRFIVTNEAKVPSSDLLAMEFTSFEYLAQTGTYLIISPQEAWSKVQSGEGSLVLIQRSNDTSLDVSEPLNVRRYVLDPSQIKVGYYEPSEWEGYIYPIYILKGRAELEDGRLANFTFFIDAIKRI